MLELHGLVGELLDEIRKLPVIDAHEHLPTEAERVTRKVDVTTLFSHYTKADLEAAGLPQKGAQEEVGDTSKPLEPRWRKLKPFVEAIRYGSYAWPAFAYVRDVLGFDDIDDDTVEAISERLQEDNRPGLYKKVLQDLCGIERSIQCKGGVEEDQPFFSYLCRDRACGFMDRGNIEGLEKETGRAIHSLGDCVGALHQYVADQKTAGAVGLKVGAAYGRRIEFEDVATSEAECVFNRLRAGVRSRLSDTEARTLEDYLLRREVEACIESDLPVVIHTGYQAGNRNDIRNARATHLWSLLNAYPEARFDLFHGSFPYVEDMTVLGKYFANVHLNMCWMHIMSPEISRQALRQWLDTVPVTKIFAFGGDYIVVEKVYGHLELARGDVAEVLAERVESGRMKPDEALSIARLLFHDNARRFYRI